MRWFSALDLFVMIQRVDPLFLRILVRLASLHGHERGVSEVADAVKEAGPTIARQILERPVLASNGREAVDVYTRSLEAVMDEIVPDREAPADMLRNLASAARDAGFSNSARALDRMAKEADAGRLDRAKRFEEFENRITDEMEDVFFARVDAKAAEYLKGDQLFGERVAKALPLAGYDIEQAGECLALELHTAAVFHLMRVMEWALRELAAHLGLPDPVEGDRNWDKMLKAITGALNSRQWQKGERQPYDAAVGFLDAVRVAWRNPSMHVEAKHDQDDARRILNAVETFTHQLAKTIA